MDKEDQSWLLEVNHVPLVTYGDDLLNRFVSAFFEVALISCFQGGREREREREREKEREREREREGREGGI